MSSRTDITYRIFTHDGTRWIKDSTLGRRQKALLPLALLNRYTALLLILLTLMLTSNCSSDKDLKERFYDRGIELGIAGKFLRAHNELSSSLKLDSLYGPAEGARRIIDEVLAKRLEGAAAIHLFKGIDLGNKRDLDGKIEEIDKAIEINANCALAFNERGIAYYDLGMFEEAIADRDRAIALSPNWSAPYFNKAIACEQLGRFEEAMDAYEHFIVLAPRRYADHVTFAREKIDVIRKRIRTERRFSDQHDGRKRLFAWN